MPKPIRMLALAGCSMLAAASSGCVQRTIHVTSDPPGALVYMNDQEIGRTPMTHKFTWYGTYDVELRKEGYQSVKTTAQVWAPWWQWIPIDFVAELLPLEDRHNLHYTLVEPTTRQSDPELLTRRGDQLKEQLASSERATTRPSGKQRKRKKSANDD